MFLSTLATTLLLMLDEIALMVDRLRTPPGAIPGQASTSRNADMAFAPGRQADGNREMNLVWTVAKRSARSKAALVPAALLISVLAPYAVLPLLFLGGTYLCYDGAKTVAPGALRLWQRERRNNGRISAESLPEKPATAVPATATLDAAIPGIARPGRGDRRAKARAWKGEYPPRPGNKTAISGVAGCDHLNGRPPGRWRTIMRRQGPAAGTRRPNRAGRARAVPLAAPGSGKTASGAERLPWSRSAPPPGRPEAVPQPP